MNAKERKEVEEAAELGDDIKERSGESFMQDMAYVQNKQYPSEMIPQDNPQVLTSLQNPNASADFPGLLDKDGVLANTKGNLPDREELMYAIGTFQLVETIFTTKQLIPVKDREGNQQVNQEGQPLFIEGDVFDMNFNPIREYVRAMIKGPLVLSRSHGTQREAILQRQLMLKKTLEKQKESEQRILGLGRS